MGDKGEGGHTIQQRETRRDTRGDKASGRRTHHATKGNKNKDKLGGKLGDKTSAREGGHTIQHRHTCGETMGDNGRQEETRPRESNTGTHVGGTMGDNGNNGRQDLRKADTPPDKGRQDLGKAGTQDKTLGRRANHPTQAHMREDNGRQRQSREGGRTIQHRHTCGETMGDKGRKDFGKADAPSNKGKQEGNNGRQDLGNAETPSNTGTHAERQ